MNNTTTKRTYYLSYLNSRHYLILFILWPFLAFFVAMTNYWQTHAKKVVYFFLVYFGLTYYIDFNTTADAVRYAFKLNMYAELPFSDFFKIVGGLYTSDTTVDVIEPLISFIVSRFTNSPNILFAVYAAIFGFFYLGSINRLYDRYKISPGYNGLIILIFFIMQIPIWAINGVRFYTAVWIFFYGAYNVILYRNAKYLLVSLAASLMHFSFLSANLILIIYYLAGNRNAIYIPMAIISFVIPQLMGPFFQMISLRMGGGLQNRYQNYTSEAYIAGRQESFEQSSWFLQLNDSLVLYYILLAVLSIRLIDGAFMREKSEKNLFSFLLLFLTFINFAKPIPSFGGRFQSVFLLFATLYLFRYAIQLTGRKIQPLVLLGLFPIMLDIAIGLRQGAESINAWILTPGLGLPLFMPGLSLASLLFN